YCFRLAICEYHEFNWSRTYFSFNFVFGIPSLKPYGPCPQGQYHTFFYSHYCKLAVKNFPRDHVCLGLLTIDWKALPVRGVYKSPAYGVEYKVFRRLEFAFCHSSRAQKSGTA